MTNPTLSSWLAAARSRLGFAHEAAEIEARVLAGEVLNMSPSRVLAWPDLELSTVQVEQLEALLARRTAREPMAYILGRKEFADFELAVDARVLIPRPETEAILEYAVTIIRDNKIATVHEIGTGSGALAIGMALAVPKLQVVASDISPEALAVARTNIERLGLADRIKLVEADLVEHITQPVELVVANLPYLPTDLAVEPELSFEPAMALWSGQDGLDHYRALLQASPTRRLVLELGANQYEPLREWILANGLAQKIAPIVAADEIVGMDIIIT